MKADSSTDRFEFQAIGHVETCFKEKFGTPRQPGLVPSSWGILRLRPELNLTDALDGLAGFSHVWLIFVFHENTNRGMSEGQKRKIHPPRMGGEKMGLFATRTPHRPNPIGLSVVRIEKIAGTEIHLAGVDLVDGTPILDIKPYLPTADSHPLAEVGWTSNRPERTLSVQISASALGDAARVLPARLAAERFFRVVREILELDPRPGFYKGCAANPNPYTDVYGFRLDDFNVVYRMRENSAEVLAVQRWADHLDARGAAGRAVSRSPIEKATAGRA